MKKILLLVIAFAFTSCSPKIHHSSKELHNQDQFDDSQLKDGGLALLSISSDPGVEDFKSSFSNKLDQNIDSLSKGSFNFIGWKNSIDRIKNTKLFEEYDRVTSSYDTPSSLDKHFLAKLNEELEVRYFMFIHLNSNNKTNTYYSGATDPKSGAIEVKATAKIWDGKSGDLVWAGESKNFSNKETYTNAKSNPEKYSTKLADGITEILVTQYDNFVKDYIQSL